MLGDIMDLKMEYPISHSCCPTREGILSGYIEKELNKSANKAAAPTKIARKCEFSRNRRSKSWSQPEEEDDIEESGEKGDNLRGNCGSTWSQMRRWVNEIDRSIDNLSHSVRGLLREEPEQDREPIRFDHTPVKSNRLCEKPPKSCQQYPLKEEISHEPANSATDRLAAELKRAREELHHAEAKHASAEALKSHLQLQLRHRSAECERMAAQMRSSASKSRHTVVRLTQELAAADARIQELMRQRELLKHAAKGQKRRAMKAEAENERLKKEGAEEMVATKRGLGEDTAKTLTHLEQENRRLREVASSYEDRLAVTEREVEKLRDRLTQTESRLTQPEGKAKISQPTDLPERPRSLTPATAETANGDNLNETPARSREIKSPLPKTDESAQYESTIRELREQLAQSDASNRSLQAYLMFLKRSYSSIFEAEDDKGGQITAAIPTAAAAVVTPEIRAFEGNTTANAE